MRDFVTASIWLKPSEEGGRETPFFVGYRPHLVALRSTQYMGVCAAKILKSSTVGAVLPGTNAEIEFDLMYFDAERQECIKLYQDLQVGTEFKILEGQRVVGSGCIQQRLQVE